MGKYVGLALAVVMLIGGALVAAQGNGWMDGPGGRERAGLPGNRGPQMVVTDLGIMKFDEETKRMYLAYYYPFSSPEMVQENTGFEIDVSRAELMEGPSPEIIRLIREEIDPGQAFIKVPKDK